MRSLLGLSIVFVIGCGGPKDREGEKIDAPPGKMDACTGLQCRVVDCESMGMPPTTVSGTVYAPNETLPLSGVTVYVPNLAPGPFSEGVKCDRCDPNLPGEPITRADSDTSGHFSLPKVPVGTDIPLVVTVGKWRRIVSIPNVNQCTDNPLPAALTRLPKNSTEGDIPKMAIVTGGCDGLECLVKKLGVSNGEFTTDTGNGRVHIYQGSGGLQTVGAGATPTKDTPMLMENLDKLKQYDVAFFACECSENPSNKSQTSLNNLRAYADLGGRAFLSHYNHHWLHGDGTTTHQTPWEPLTSCTGAEGTGPESVTIDQMDNPKGPTFAQWMLAVGGATAAGVIQLEPGTGRQTCSGIADPVERWAFNGTNPQMFQMLTPVDVDPKDRCGKVVFSDMHVSTNSSGTFPSNSDGCSGELSQQEKALAYMFFDIASCIDVIN